MNRVDGNRAAAYVMLDLPRLEMPDMLRKWRTRFDVKVVQPIDNRLWRLISHEEQRYCFHHVAHLDAIATYFPHVRLHKLRDDDPNVFKFLVHRVSEYAYAFPMPITIEPRRGWLIPQAFRVLEHSFPLVHDPWDSPKPRPSTAQYFGRQRIVATLDQAVSVRYAWNNYYHFLIDALPQLHLLDSLGVSRNIPIVVPQSFTEMPYVKEFRQISDFFDGRHFVVQPPNTYVKVVDTSYVAKDAFFSSAIFHVLDTLTPASLTVDRGDRLFVRRDPSGPRSLSNDTEVTRVAEAHGFRVVETAGMSLREQISLFSGARIVAGIHGAGLTNIVFRNRRELRLLEICPSGLTPHQYESLCIQFGYQYARLLGSPLDINRRFYIDPLHLENALRSMLD